MYRIGQGWDRHRMLPGRRCILGGVVFPESPTGPEAHSDGDVVCHALSDALLGALALGDLGHHFPDTDPRYAGADSVDLLRQVRQMVAARGYGVVNVDCTIIAETPQIAPLVTAMQEILATALAMGTEQVSVKATRGEGVGPEGRGECITVQAVALLAQTATARQGS